MRKPNPWLMLTLLALAQFVVVLDVTIVNVALPHIQSDLHFSTAGLQWIVNAYTLMFGGFLLLGGRAADLLGRRRLFVSGMALFTAASLTAGLAQSETVMIAARVAQGLGGAMMSPAALSLVTVTFAHGRERNIAMGIWGALAGLGGTFGVVLGGIIVTGISWRAVFFVNVPIGIAVIALAPMLIAESRIERGRAPRNFDLPGAILGTGGLLALVFGIVRTQALGWGSLEVIVSLAAGIATLAAFVLVELRAEAPLVPMNLFRPTGMRSSVVALTLNGAVFLAMFFLTAIFLQQVRGSSALDTGLELLPMGVAAITAAGISSSLVQRVGTRTIQIAGGALSVAGLLLLSRAGAGGSYVVSLLPGLMLFGAGLVSIGVTAQIAAVAEVSHDDSGAASAIINTAFQIGGALGLAVITTLADTHIKALVHSGLSGSLAQTAGFQRGLLAAAILAAVNLAFAIGAPQIRPTTELITAAAAA